jgi:hypothetical protein
VDFAEAALVAVARTVSVDSDFQIYRLARKKRCRGLLPLE